MSKCVTGVNVEIKKPQKKKKKKNGPWVSWERRKSQSGNM
jgi:hypothetical protein